MQIPCVILCGGKSSRMGENKALLPFKNTSMIQHQFYQMKEIFQEVFISSKIPLFSLPTIIEKTQVFSPLIGIYQSLQTLPYQRVFFICVDTPFLQRETITKLLNSPQVAQILYFKTQNHSHYLTSIWDKSTLIQIKHNLDQKRYAIKSLIQSCHSDFIFHQNETEFNNLNTKADYNNALFLMEKGNING